MNHICLLCSLIHVIFTQMVLSQNKEYRGPVSGLYFQDQSISTSHIPELTCTGAYYNFYIDLNYSDGTDVYFGKSNITNPVKYYKLHITSEMKKAYRNAMYVSTCCQLAICDIITAVDSNESLELCNQDAVNYYYELHYAYTHGFYSNFSDIWTYSQTFCSINTSLDTIIYLLQEKKNQLTLLETKDDSTCNNQQKSYINLLNYPVGEYIIAVGGFAKENGSFFLQFLCLQHSFPITQSQLNPPTNTTSIACNQTIDDDMNPVQSAKYYLLNITKSTHLPINISVSTWSATVLYLMKSVTNNYVTGSNFEILINPNYEGFLTIDESILPVPATHHLSSKYYVIVQGIFLGWEKQINYSLSMTCGYPPTEEPTVEPSIQPSKIPTTAAPTQAKKIAYSTMAGIVFAVCGIIFMIFVGYYIYVWRKYKKGKKTKEARPPIQKRQSSDFTSIPQQEQDNSDDEEPEPKGIPMTNLNDESSCGMIIGNKKEDWDRRITRDKSSVAGITIRRMDADQSVKEQLSHGEDIVQLVLAHSIKCCEDQNGFDIYQVLAIRYYEINSGNIVEWFPLKRIGINAELVKLSPLFLTCVQAIFIACTQCWGVTVVVFKLIDSYFNSDGDDDICNMEEYRWVEVWSLKVLSFLLSLSITFYIRILITGLQSNGLYKIMDQLSLKDLHRIDNISIWCVQLGQMVNYYVCLWAILGSYFIIFEGNRGEINLEDGSIDYADTGLDMILNAVALFFMLELDDMMVTEQDYIDCADHLAIILKDYKPDISINKFYSPSLNNLLEEAADEVIEREKREFQKRRPDTITQKAYNKCAQCMIPTMYYLVNFCSIFVPFCCYCGGFIAPFLIFFCW